MVNCREVVLDGGDRRLRDDMLEISHGGSHSEHGLSWLGSAAIFATFSASSSTAFFPFIFGRLGFVAAPVLLGLYIALCCYLQQKVLDLALLFPEARNTPALAGLVAGRFARNTWRFLQIGNQLIFLPCAWLIQVKALKQIVLPASPDNYVRPSEAPGILSCNIVWLFMFTLVALLATNLQRRFGHAVWLCKAGCLFNMLQGLLIVTRVMLNPRDHHGQGLLKEAFPAFPLTTNKHERGYWVDVFTALSSFGYCYVPCFIATEVMQELRVKSEVGKALWSSTGCMFILYSIVGIFPVVAWGWDRQFDIFTELQADSIGRFANAMLLMASAMSFVITAISLNQRLQERVDPGFDPRDWSKRACAKWFLYSLPSLSIGFVMLCFIPNLASLVGLLTAFVVPCSQTMGPAVLLWLSARKGMLGRELSCLELIAVVSGFCTGVLMIVVGGASTVHSIFFSGPLFHGNFFCDAVAG